MAYPIEIIPYKPCWPEQFAVISTQLTSYLKAGNVYYTGIEHVGSTSIPGLAGKDQIDIVIIVPNGEQAEKAKEALIWQPEDSSHYKCIGNGGIDGRISMKIVDPDALPRRSVYIIREDEPIGRLCLRNYRTLKETLKKQEFRHLMQEYAKVKINLGVEQLTCGVEYGRRKNKIIRKILRAGGWTEDEVDIKESLNRRRHATPPY